MTTFASLYEFLLKMVEANILSIMILMLSIAAFSITLAASYHRYRAERDLVMRLLDRDVEKLMELSRKIEVSIQKHQAPTRDIKKVRRLLSVRLSELESKPRTLLERNLAYEQHNPRGRFAYTRKLMQLALHN